MAAATPLICACDDDRLYHRALQAALGSAYRFDFSADGAGLLCRLAARRPALVLLDLRLAPDDDGHGGLALLARLRAGWPELPVVVHTAVTQTALLARALALGAAEVVPKDGDLAAVRASLRRWAAACRGGHSHAVAPPPTQHPPTQHPPTQGAAMARLAADIARLRPRSGNVIILGESGAGKERVAQALAQPGRPFVAVDAATLHEQTALSALFGHERGAYTGAAGARRGLLEEADGGVLFIDEVANLTLSVQAILLRALASQQVVPLGATRPRQLAFRVVAASHRDLAELCRRGAFRYDLLARLEVFTLEVPPLRHRLDGLDALVAEILAALGAPDARLAPAVRAFFGRYAWPGNVRELAHALEHALAMRDGDGHLTLAHLPARLQRAALAPTAGGAASVPGTLHAAPPHGARSLGDAGGHDIYAHLAAETGFGAAAAEAWPAAPPASPRVGHRAQAVPLTTDIDAALWAAAEASVTAVGLPPPRSPPARPEPQPAAFDATAMGRPEQPVAPARNLANPMANGTLATQLQSYERELLAAAYVAFGHNVAAMARSLAVDRTTLHRKLCRYGLHRPSRRGGSQR